MFIFLSWCSALFILVLSLFDFSPLTLAVLLFTCKLCLQISGLRMRDFTWNRLPIQNLLIDSLLTPIGLSLERNWSLISTFFVSKKYSKIINTGKINTSLPSHLTIPAAPIVIK